jgi:hypothetical protein
MKNKQMIVAQLYPDTGAEACGYTLRILSESITGGKLIIKYEEMF